MSNIDTSGFQPTEYDHVWKDTDGTFYYTDEAEQPAGPFIEISMAKAALDAYVTHHLKGEPTVEDLSQAVERGGVEGLLQLYKMLNSPKFTKDEMVAEIERVIPILQEVTATAAAQFTDQFKTPDEALRYWVSGFLATQIDQNAERGIALLMRQRVGAPTVEDAIEVAKTILFPIFFGPIPDTELFAYVGRGGNLETDVRQLVVDHWKHHGNMVEHEKHPELYHPQGMDEIIEKSRAQAVAILTAIAKPTPNDKLDEAFLLATRHVQSEYILGAAHTSMEELQKFLLTTGLGGPILTRNDAADWLSEAIRIICIHVDDVDADFKDQVHTWDQNLADALQRTFERLMPLVLAELA